MIANYRTRPVAGTSLRLGASSADLIIAACLVIATLAVAVYCAPRGFQGGFVDMAHDGYQLRQALDLSEGGVIFRDTFEQYGPLQGYLNTLGFLALGRSLLAMKYFICGWYALISVLLYMMARQWLNPALAGFSGVVWLALAPFYQHGIMLSPHVYALLFQTLATIVALRSRRLEPRRFLLVGILAALSWSVKQSFGALYLLSILVYLLLRATSSRADWRRVAAATVTVAAGFFAVVGLLLAWLWSQRALQDWYLQTVAFPREFYLRQLIEGGAGNRSSFWTAPLNFAQLQIEWPSWVIIRAVVLMTAAVQLLRRRVSDDLLLMAPITALLWLGAYPSGNFMHQWWTASLTIAPFVVCMRAAASRIAARDRSASWIAVAAVLAVIFSGVMDRARAVTYHARSLDQTLVQPSLFRGIRTDAQTERAFALLYGTMERFRIHHPGTKVVSIESSDGWRAGVAESLPLLSFFDGNTRSHPVYWSLPSLSTVVYPRYGEALWTAVRTQQPLIVDHHNGKYAATHIAGYFLLAAAQSDYGYWYVYAADHDERIAHGEVSTFVRNDGLIESGFAELNRRPSVIDRLASSTGGSWRGRLMPSPGSDASVTLHGPDPLELFDPAVRTASEPVNVYTWPADLAIALLDRPLTPLSTNVAYRAGIDIVKDFGSGAIVIDGRPQGPFSYLLQWPEEPVQGGTYFVAHGELFEGGVQIGVLRDGKWAGSVNVTHTGPFEAILYIGNQGRYGLVIANCIESNWRRDLSGTRNRFRISQAGWIGPRYGWKG